MTVSDQREFEALQTEIHRNFEARLRALEVQIEKVTTRKGKPASFRVLLRWYFLPVSQYLKNTTRVGLAVDVEGFSQELSKLLSGPFFVYTELSARDSTSLSLLHQCVTVNSRQLAQMDDYTVRVDCRGFG